MDETRKFWRVGRVFLARLLRVHGRDAPAVLRQLADELEALERDRNAEQH